MIDFHHHPQGNRVHQVDEKGHVQVPEDDSHEIERGRELPAPRDDYDGGERAHRHDEQVAVPDERGAARQPGEQQMQQHATAEE